MKLTNLKNITIATMAAITLLTGCSGNDGNVKKKYTEEDLGVYDTKTEKLIKLGDSRETIEKYIGGNWKSDLVWTTYRDGLSIIYDENNKAVHLWLIQDDRYQLPTGINTGCKVVDFQNMYTGYTEVKGGWIDSLYASEIYLEKKDNGEVKQITSEEYEKNEDDKEKDDNSICLCVEYGDYESINGLRIYN